MNYLNVKIVFQKLTQTIKRFPVPLLCAFLAVCFIVVKNNLMPIASNELLQNNLLRLTLESVAGISLFYSFHIFSENKKLDYAKRAGLILLGICILGLHFYSIPADVYNFETNYNLRYFIVIVCFHLVISFSLFYQEKNADAFWQYNEYLFVLFITAILFSTIFYLGIAGATWAVDVLFGQDIPDKYYINFLAIIFLLFNTFFVFYKIPTDTQYFEKEHNYQNGLLVFLQYVLMPIMAIYGLILAVYFIKIIFGNVLPKGWVVFPILIFSGLGILTYFFAYSLRNGTNGVIKFFYKNFFYILLPFLTLYFKSIGTRIFTYGFTENRYIILVLGIWLLFISLVSILYKKNRIVIFPISLCIVLTLSCFGPWGMYKFSAFSQFNRLKNILHKNNLMQHGKLIENKNSITLSKNKIDEIDSKHIVSIIDYLYKHNEIDRLKNILSVDEINKLEEFKKVGFSEKNVGSMLGINGIPFNHVNEISTFFTCNSNQNGIANNILNIKGYSKILQINTYDLLENNEEINTQDSTSYYSSLSNNTLKIINKNETLLTVNLDSLTQKINKYIVYFNKDSTILDNTISRISLPYRHFYFSRDSLTHHFANATLYIDEIKCKKTKSTTKAVNINGFVVF